MPKVATEMSKEKNCRCLRSDAAKLDIVPGIVDLIDGKFLNAIIHLNTEDPGKMDGKPDRNRHIQMIGFRGNDEGKDARMQFMSGVPVRHCPNDRSRIG